MSGLVKALDRETMMNLPRYAQERMFSKSRGKVRSYTYKEDKPSLEIQADTIIFLNNGQNFCIIDDVFPLAPGGRLKLRNVTNDFQWRFVTNGAPPTADGVLVKSGNYLSVYILNGNGDIDCDVTFDNPSTINTGDITVSVTPATPVTDAPTGELTLDTSITIPAGKTEVRIINKGDMVPVGGIFGANVSAEVTTASLATELPVDPDGIVLTNSGANTAANEYGTLPEITIDNSGGAAIWWYAV